jgi:hypothetical protein
VSLSAAEALLLRARRYIANGERERARETLDAAKVELSGAHAKLGPQEGDARLRQALIALLYELENALDDLGGFAGFDAMRALSPLGEALLRLPGPIADFDPAVLAELRARGLVWSPTAPGYIEATAKGARLQLRLASGVGRP